MTLEPGKLYKTTKYFWFLFPTKETAAAATDVALALDAPITAAAVVSWASYWSKKLSCNVSFIGEGDIILVVEVSGIQVKVISQEGNSGWINFPADEHWAEGAIVPSFGVDLSVTPC